MNSELALDIKNLSYSYRGEWTRKTFSALSNITLQVKHGESFGFLGHNGAGKTTTIKCILNLIRPSAGQIAIYGKSALDTKARAMVGYLPEQPYFYDYLTVEEIMTMYTALAGVASSDSKNYIAQALELVKMGGRTKARMRTLSKGLTQRVALAQAIVAKPRLLILDEPFSGLDPIGRREFRDVFSFLKQNGTTIFMSSHILSDVEFLCDRASIMAHGTLKGVFDLKNVPAVVGQSYELVLRDFNAIKTSITSACDHWSSNERFLNLSFKDRSKAELALKTALEGGAIVESYESKQGSLEDLFMQLVKYEETRP